jgi:hypothetical protein
MLGPQGIPQVTLMLITMCKDVMHCQNLSEAYGYSNKVRLLDECSNLFWGWAGLCIASKNSADA